MRFMVIVKATPSSETGEMPTPEAIAAMDKYNEELMAAGIRLTADGLQPSAKGARIHFTADDQRTVTDGPFTETKELVSGFWLWQCASLQEAIDWAKRCPHPWLGEPTSLEIRPLYEMEDFA